MGKHPRWTERYEGALERLSNIATDGIIERRKIFLVRTLGIVV